MSKILLLLGSCSFAEEPKPRETDETKATSNAEETTTQLLVSLELAAVLDTVYAIKHSREFDEDLIHIEYVPNIMQAIALGVAYQPPGEDQKRIAKFLADEQERLQSATPKEAVSTSKKFLEKLTQDAIFRKQVYDFIRSFEDKMKEVLKKKNWSILSTMIPESYVLAQVNIEPQKAVVRLENKASKDWIDLVFAKRQQQWVLQQSAELPK